MDNFCCLFVRRWFIRMSSVQVTNLGQHSNHPLPLVCHCPCCWFSEISVPPKYYLGSEIRINFHIKLISSCFPPHSISINDIIRISHYVHKRGSLRSHPLPKHSCCCCAISACPLLSSSFPVATSPVAGWMDGKRGSLSCSFDGDIHYWNIDSFHSVPLSLPACTCGWGGGSTAAVLPPFLHLDQFHW